MRVLAIGDIHTKIDIIEQAAEVIDFYNAIVFVGDYADDWKASPQLTIGTWRRLKDFQESHPSKVKIIMGNHDYIYVNYTKSTQSGYSKFTQTLIDMPENRDLREWLRQLPITLELDGVTYSHAGLTESFEEGDNLWDDNSPIWARPDISTYRNIPQVFGHTPSDTCWEVSPNVWCIDTFSTYPDGEKVGDETVLEVTNGENFAIKSLEKLYEQEQKRTTVI